nr:histidine kinase N-terminal domain-containing protein [Caldilineaceae bacterium]
KRIEEGAALTADLSRADVLICCPLTKDKVLVAAHIMPFSTPSLYRQAQTGQLLTREQQPLIFYALASGSGGRRQREVLRHGAPVFQDVFPIHSEERRVIAVLVMETSMIAYERQRRRNHHFRRAVLWLQEMNVRGALEGGGGLSRFGQYDGVYLVNRQRTIVYMSGIASNLFRSLGVLIDAVGEQMTLLETSDTWLVEEAFTTGRCLETRDEAPDGRVWLRKAVPIQAPAAHWLHRWLVLPWYGAPRTRKSDAVDAVVVMVHNATEAVQKQRELNVKSAIIQEVHHRVKNNGQNIAAVLRKQSRRSNNEEARIQLLDAVNRVLSMAVIHEYMSQDEHRAINLRDVCQRIASQVVDVIRAPDQEIHIQVHGPNIRLPADQATPAALMVNELLLNAVEHGVGERPHGEIEIVLQDLGDQVEVTITDDGHGLPPGFDPLHHASLGLQIVRTLATDDLKGAFRLESGQAVAPPLHEGAPVAEIVGTRALVTFPKRPLQVD